MATVERPWARADVKSGLEILVDLQPGTPQRDWEFTNGVHWFIDDTWWDQRDPTDDVGDLLMNHAEAASAPLAVGDLMKVLSELGPDAPYDDYLAHAGWETARASMRALLDLLVENDE